MALVVYGIMKGTEKLLEQKLEHSGPFDEFDDTPTTTATRGSFVPWLVGHRRVGASILWVGDRKTVSEIVGTTTSSGGKGSSKSKSRSNQTQTIYHESAWHGLCVGPAVRLHRIWKRGKLVYEGPIDSSVSPSGTSFETDEGDSFTIFWGERTQSINTYLGDASRVSVSSRWPNLCYVIWEEARLGTSPTWPMFEYEIEVPCYEGETGNLVCNTNGDYSDGVGGWVYTDADPTLNGGYNEWNGAHTLDQLLFSEWPQGLSLDQDQWENLSLEHLGETIDGDGLFTSALAKGGMTAKEVVEGLMEDLGFVITWEVRWNAVSLLDWSGFVTRPIRNPSTGPTPPTLPTDMICDQSVPEIEVLHKESAVTVAIWGYSDRDRAYAQMTIVVDDDGESGFLEHAKAERFELFSITSFSQASQVAERRSQERLAVKATYTIFADKSARFLTAGRAFWIEGLDPVLRVESISIPMNSSKVEIKAVEDFYGLTANGFVPDSSGAATFAPASPADDLAASLLEIPAELAQGQVTVAILRIRADDRQQFADDHVSRDNVTYTNVARDRGVITGGTLTEAMLADDSYYIAQGPEFTSLGPDIGEVDDLSTNLERWAFGDQMAVIGEEIFFVQAITPISGTTYRLDGLMRARYNTDRALHSIGDTVFIFGDTQPTLLLDPLIQPAVDLYAKANPFAGTTFYGLGSVSALSKLPLYGLGVRPEPVENLRVTAPEQNVPAYETGDDLEFAWSYFSQAPGTSFSGAGLQNAGDGCPTGVVQGEFFIEITDTSDVVQRSLTQTDTDYTYSNATLVSDFGSEQDIKFKVYHQNGGLIAPVVSLTVEFI